MPGAGIVVAGGHSVRFGAADKALATVGGEALVRRVASALGAVTPRVVVNCRSAQVPAVADALAPLAVPVSFATDRRPDRGPAAGLARALEAVACDRVLVSACDLPFVSPKVLDGLVTAMDSEAVVAVDDTGRPMPLLGCYETAALARALEDTSDVPLCSVLDTLAWRPHPLGERVLLDVNTEADRRRAETLLEVSP